MITWVSNLNHNINMNKATNKCSWGNHLYFFLCLFIGYLQANQAQQHVDDPDAVQQPDGTWMWKGPKGRLETWAQRQKRLAHNTRMCFNRSFESSDPAIHLYIFIFKLNTHKCCHVGDIATWYDIYIYILNHFVFINKDII